MSDKPPSKLHLSENTSRYIASVRECFPNAPMLADLFTEAELRALDEAGVPPFAVFEIGYHRASDLKRGHKHRESIAGYLAPLQDQLARRACETARTLVDAYVSGERDEDDRRPRKPTKNGVALAAYHAVYHPALPFDDAFIRDKRSAANTAYDKTMTADRLARLGLVNPLDELSACTPRTRRR